MVRILVTGSTDGLGRATAAALLDQGHDVVVHARNDERARALDDLVRRGAGLVVADLADRDAVRALGSDLADNPLDAVVHNAGVGGGADVMEVNVVAPYLLTALMTRPRRLVYLSSGMHRGGRPGVLDGAWRRASYSDSKLCLTALAAAVARRRPDVVTSAVDPGWVATRMGGPSAPDDFEEGHRTQEWLAVGDDPETRISGAYWHHRERQQPHAAAADEAFQDRLLDVLADETGVRL